MQKLPIRSLGMSQANILAWMSLSSEQALASAKVGMALTNKLYAIAHKHHDADGVAWVTKKACQDVRARSLFC